VGDGEGHRKPCSCFKIARSIPRTCRTSRHWRERQSDLSSSAASSSTTRLVRCTSSNSGGLLRQRRRRNFAAAVDEGKQIPRRIFLGTFFLHRSSTAGAMSFATSIPCVIGAHLSGGCRAQSTSPRAGARPVGTCRSRGLRVLCLEIFLLLWTPGAESAVAGCARRSECYVMIFSANFRLLTEGIGLYRNQSFATNEPRVRCKGCF
jgi:hypothetical protein